MRVVSLSLGLAFAFLRVTSCDFVDRLLHPEKNDPRSNTKKDGSNLLRLTRTEHKVQNTNKSHSLFL